MSSTVVFSQSLGEITSVLRYSNVEKSHLWWQEPSLFCQFSILMPKAMALPEHTPPCHHPFDPSPHEPWHAAQRGRLEQRFKLRVLLLPPG